MGQLNREEVSIHTKGWIRSLTFTVNDGKPVRSDVEIAEHVDGCHIRQQRHLEMFSGWERLFKYGYEYACMNHSLERKGESAHLLTELRLCLECHKA